MEIVNFVQKIIEMISSVGSLDDIFNVIREFFSFLG